jgi:hypothetical protein
MIGDHGAAILQARGDMQLDAEIVSDCAPLHRLIAALLDAVPTTRFLRDATRGGLATVLVEIAEASRVDIEIHWIRSTWPTRARSSAWSRRSRPKPRSRPCARSRRVGTRR